MQGMWIRSLGQEDPLMKVKEENEKAGLKFNIQKTKTNKQKMTSGPIISW